MLPSLLLREWVGRVGTHLHILHTLTPSHPHSEESTAVPDVGVDMLMKDGKLEHLKNGPIYWVDSADVNPCMGKNIM